MGKYIYAILISIIIFISGALLYQGKQLAKYKNLYNKELQNVEAYQISNSELKGEVRQYQMTMDDIRASKDSIDKKLAQMVDKLKIKDSKVEYLQYQTATATKQDTIFFKDTLFVNKVDIDTLIQDEWYKLRLGLHYPSEVSVSPTFNSEKYIIVNSKKVYNKPPSKIFFIRWFQKKHQVIEVNIEEKSPYIINKNNKFIKVLN